MIENPISCIVIMNHVDRLTEAKVLQKIIKRQADEYGIPVYIQTDYTSHYKDKKHRYRGVAENYLKCLTYENSHTGRWRIVIQDDVLFPPMALKNVLVVLKNAPKGHVIGLYNPTNSGYTEAESQGKHIMSTIANLWTQCTAWDEELIAEYIKWTEDNVEVGLEGEDFQMYVFHKYTNRRMLIAIPSLVQHLGRNRSMFGTPGTINGVKRCSENYNPDFRFEDVDWEAEFANPYMDKVSIPTAKALRLFKQKSE